MGALRLTLHMDLYHLDIFLSVSSYKALPQPYGWILPAAIPLITIPWADEGSSRIREEPKCVEGRRGRSLLPLRDGTIRLNASDDAAR